MDTNHGGSNLDADHPQQGVNVPRLTTNKSLNAMLGAQSEFAVSVEPAFTMDLVTGRL